MQTSKAAVTCACADGSSRNVPSSRLNINSEMSRTSFSVSIEKRGSLRYFSICQMSICHENGRRKSGCAAPTPLLHRKLRGRSLLFCLICHRPELRHTRFEHFENDIWCSVGAQPLKILHSRKLYCIVSVGNGRPKQLARGIGHLSAPRSTESGKGRGGKYP